jgi:tetratricopeptide (TPR) repeat protein
MPKLDRLQLWKMLLLAWDQGPAQQFEMATLYTRRFPRRVEGWVVLAEGLAGTARYREAEAALRKADRCLLPEQRWHIAIQWGHLYREKHDLKRAERWYRKAVALNPITGNHIFLGATLAKQGRFAEAKRHHRRAIQVAKTPHEKDLASEAYLNLAVIYRAERRYREAVASLKKAIQIDPRYKDARDALKDVEQAMKLRSKEKRGD